MVYEREARLNAQKKALFVLPAGAIGGAERVMYNIADHLLRSGWTVSVYLMSKSANSPWSNLGSYKSFSLFRNSANSEKYGVPGLVAFFLKARLGESFDYVFSSHLHINAALSLFRRLSILRCRYLISRESTKIFDRFSGWRRKIFVAFYRHCYGTQDLLIYQTLEMRDSLVSALGFSPVRKAIVLQNPVNIHYIQSMLKRSDIQKVNRSFDVVVAAGRLIELKGFYNLILAFPAVLEKRPNAKLFILGEGPQRPSLEKLIADKGLSDHIQLVGHVGNPYGWFSQANLGVCSSRIEGFPNVLIEMMASGIGSIVSSPCTDAVKSLPGVLVSESNSPDHLADVVIDGLSRSDNRAMYSNFIEKYCSILAYWNSIENLVEG